MGRITGAESGAIMTLAYSYVTKLPQINVSELKQLQWSIEIAQKDYAKAAVNTSLAT